MQSPFPGMDPYLEDPTFWPDVHHRLITVMGDSLAAAVSPRFHVRIEERIYLTDPEDDPGYSVIVPDIVVTRKPGEPSKPREAGPARITSPVLIEDLLDPEIHDRYLEVRDARSQEIVTAIELLSPANKVKGSRGRRSLVEKRTSLRRGGAHWLEIDLLREGQRPMKLSGRSEYCVLLLRRGHPEAEVWFFGLRSPLPAISVPLRPPHPDVSLDLQAVFHETYERARYADSIDYGRDPPSPSLSTEDSGWARAAIESWRASRPAGES